MKVDINCDVGEGVANEHLIMPYISSCNIACGGHFGDKQTIDKTIQLAAENGVKIGAHPSFPDKKNFGRRFMELSKTKLKESITHQLDLFLERLSLVQKELHHIKPHGALYNAIAVDEQLAKTIVEILKPYLNSAFLYVPYNSVIAKIALQSDVKIKYEAFADRNYNDDLTLVSRAKKKALLADKSDVLNHVIFILKHNKVKTISGLKVPIKADTFCVHGDSENVLEIVSHLHRQLQKEGFVIR